MKKTIYEMCAAELRQIAKENNMPGAWKANKGQMIEFLESINYEAPEETEETVEDENLETEETEEASGTEMVPETEEAEEETEAPKEVKKPSLGIKEIEFNGKTQSLKAWAEELEMPWPTLYDRINRNGWTIEEALTIPLGGRRKK